MGEINSYITKLREKEAKNLIVDKIIDDLKKMKIIANQKNCKNTLKIFCQITKNEKHAIKNKTNRNWKRPWNNLLEQFLGCKNYTRNFEPQAVKLTNKTLREKSSCVVCRSSQSRFLK